MDKKHSACVPFPTSYPDPSPSSRAKSLGTRLLTFRFVPFDSTPVRRLKHKMGIPHLNFAQEFFARPAVQDGCCSKSVGKKIC